MDSRLCHSCYEVINCLQNYEALRWLGEKLGRERRS
jgi:hypothetical protein